MSAAPLIIAHRGASAHAPENTLAALRMAVDAGADGVEFDVQLSNDGVPVVFHDLDLKRIADQKTLVSQLTAEQLAGIDVGSWFNRKHPKAAREEFASEGIPTLAAVMELLRDYRGKIYVELKADERHILALTAAVCHVLSGSPLMPLIIVKSFRLAAIPEVRRLLPGMKTAALFAPNIMDYLRRRKHIVALAREFGADQISLHRSLATAKLCSLAAEAGMPVTVWTADKPKWIERCRKRRIAALITNDPVKMLAARDSIKNF